MKTALVLIGLVFGLTIGYFIGMTHSQSEIIHNGHGHYDQKTGQFVWGAPEKVAETP